MSFTGTYVKIAGLASRSGTTVVLDGSASNFMPLTTVTPQTIYEHDSLPDHEHQLIISPAANEQFSLDYITYRPSAGVTPENNSNNPNGGGNSGTNPKATPLKKGAIGGVVVGIIFGLALLVLGVIWSVKRSRRQQPPKAEKKIRAGSYSGTLFSKISAFRFYDCTWIQMKKAFRKRRGHSSPLYIP